MSKRNVFTLTLIGIFMFASLAAGISWLTRGANVDVEAMSAANQLYEAGHYFEAAKIYEQLLSQGVQSSALYYNLGNTYYQQGDLGRAILNYQRAAQLDPRDAGIQANLALAQEQAVNLYPDEPGGPLQSLADISGRWLTLDESAWLTLSLWFVLGFLVVLWRQIQAGRLRNGVQYALFLVLFFVVIGGLSLGSRMYIERTQPGGVIVAPVVAVSSAPGADQPTSFELHSGTEVHLRGSQGDWIRLDLPGENDEGWIPLEAVEFIAGDLKTPI